jgi:hypothetical protein
MSGWQHSPVEVESGRTTLRGVDGLVRYLLLIMRPPNWRKSLDFQYYVLILELGNIVGRILNMS